VLYRNLETSEAIDAEYDLSQVIGDPSGYFDFFIKESARARGELDSLLDVHYGPTQAETLGACRT
jgi:hypothetical protein